MKLTAGTVLVLASCSFLLATTPEAPPEKERRKFVRFETGIDFGWRTDYFKWTIAGTPAGSDPNILSELEWQNLHIFEIGIEPKLTLFDRLVLFTGIRYGWILGGENRDSDYLLDNRGGEFSRSSADVSGYTVDITPGIGWRFELFDGRIVFIPQVGFAYHRQYLYDTNGYQELAYYLFEYEDQVYGIPLEPAPFKGLGSRYQGEWWGPWIGGELELVFTRGFKGVVFGRYEWSRYKGSAYWNLRDLHFTDIANGSGFVVGGGLEWQFAKHWKLYSEAQFSSFTTHPGVQITHDPEGDFSTRLNEVIWWSVAVRGGIGFVF